jgi:hypothetical protein
VSLKLIQIAVALFVALGFSAQSLAQNPIRLAPGERFFARQITVFGDCLNGGAITYQTSGFFNIGPSPAPVFTGSGTFTGLRGANGVLPILLLDALDPAGRPILLRFDFRTKSEPGDPPYPERVENIPPRDYVRELPGLREGACGNQFRPSNVLIGLAGAVWVGYQYDLPPQPVPISNAMNFAALALVLLIGLNRLRFIPAPTPTRSPAPHRYTSYRGRIFRRKRGVD